jgi:RNA-directed DNA polymerase
MDDHIRKTAAADKIVSTRQHLAALLGVNVDVISDFTSDPARHYTEFPVPKPNGEVRIIRPPRRPLRKLQRSLLGIIYKRVQLRTCLHGGIRRRSIVTHASPHVGRFLVATLDIRKFYPSTTPEHLAPVFAAIGFLNEASEDLLGLVTLNNELPQGAPTSSLLANLAFASGDTRFIEICSKRRLSYTRYVDDIAISGEDDFRDLRADFVKIIESTGYSVADEKIRFMPKHDRQVVTGLIVNDRMRPTPVFLREIKDDIRLCLEHGAVFMAEAEGLTVTTLKKKLTGRVAHVRHIDAKLGKRLHGRLCGVNWRSTAAGVAE